MGLLGKKVGENGIIGRNVTEVGVSIYLYCVFFWTKVSYIQAIILKMFYSCMTSKKLDTLYTCQV